MKSFLLLSLLLGELFLISSGQGVIFCVKPNSTDTCSPEDHCQQCQTLQYYCDNVDATNGISKQYNVTMIFMEGTHILNTYQRTYQRIHVSTLSMKGKSKNNVSLIIDGLIGFDTDGTLSMENLTIMSLNHYAKQEVNFNGDHSINSELVLKDCTFQGQILIVGFAKTWLKNCKFGRFYDTTFLQFFMTQEIILEDCDIHGAGINIQFSNGSAYGKLNVVIKGDSKFSACHINPAILISDSADQGNVTLSGKVTFVNNIAGAMYLHSSTLTIASGANINFTNNSAMGSGGAMYLYSSHFYVKSGANITFANNTAFDRGGAIFIEPGISSDVRVSDALDHSYCFMAGPMDYDSVTISFDRNLARNGDDIYGASLSDCVYSTLESLNINRLSTPSISSVSSKPLRVCLCDSDGVPRCNVTHNMRNITVHPGESFTVSAVLVGWDYSNASTTGVVYAEILSTNNLVNPQLDSNSQNGHLISNSKQCTNLSFSLFSSHITPQNTTMYVTAMKMENQYVLEHKLQNCLYTNDCWRITPVFFNVTLLPCPPGFTLKDKQGCTCYLEHILFESCSIVNGIGYFSWNQTAWVSISDQRIQYNTYCPLDYCNITGKEIDLQNDYDSQCAFNRAGRLCGGCKESYSLAIGSSHCIHCPNNNNLALLIFFAAVGFLLVFFISAFNLTVTEGMINGLIFYANIVWAYQDLLFPQQSNANANVLSLMYFEKTFIAWLNLDFGIQTCFFDGLNAFWKTWLQYVFPTYTAGLFFIGLRYSSKLSKLFGSRSVPTLATLLFLSYTKLLRTIITSLELAQLINYPNDSSQYVWSIDGTLDYGQSPHITLLLMAIACLLILWLPYTMLLFLMQWLRRIPNYRISKWITQYKPVIDAYFAPLKDGHHYWFGMLLLSRGILLLISSLTANINPAVSLFLLLGVATLLLCYINFKRVYKKTSVLILESAFLINLIVLTGGAMYYYDRESSEKVVLIGLSIGITFIKFCGIVIWSIVQLFPRCRHCQQQNNVPYENIDEDTQLFQGRETIQVSGQPRDPILEDSELIPTY